MLNIKLLLLLAIASSVLATEVRKCESGPSPTKVEITGCDQPPCKLIKGQSTELNVQFTSTKSTKILKPKVTTKALGLTIPYQLPGDQADACNHLFGSQCPIDENEDINYQLTMPILKIYPSVNLEIQLEMLDEDNSSQFCFIADCQVVNG